MELLQEFKHRGGEIGELRHDDQPVAATPDADRAVFKRPVRRDEQFVGVVVRRLEAVKRAGGPF